MHDFHKKQQQRAQWQAGFCEWNGLGMLCEWFMVTECNRQNYGKKNVQLRQAAPASDLSIIVFSP